MTGACRSQGEVDGVVVAVGVPMSFEISAAISRSTSDIPRLIECDCFWTSRMPRQTSQSKVLDPGSMTRLCSVPIEAIFSCSAA
jgi:hypothetical protein